MSSGNGGRRSGVSQAASGETNAVGLGEGASGEEAHCPASPAPLQLLFIGCDPGLRSGAVEGPAWSSL